MSEPQTPQTPPTPPQAPQTKLLQRLILLGGGLLLVVLAFTDRKALVSKVPDQTGQANEAPATGAPAADAPTSTAPLVMSELEALAPGTEVATVLPKLQQKLAQATTRKDSLAALQNLVAAASNLQRKDYAALYQQQLWQASQNPTDLLSAAELMTEARDLYQLLESRQPMARRFNAQAIALYDQYLALKPEAPEALVGKAICQVHSDAPMQGITALRSLADAASTPPALQFKASKELGIFSLQTGQLDKGLERFKRCIALAPDNFEGHYLMGTALKMQNKPEDARPYLKKALSLSPDPKIQRQIANDIEQLSNPAHQH